MTNLNKDSSTHNYVLLDDDFFQDEAELVENKNEKIKILIVDDEEEVHKVTILALDGFDYKGRLLEIISAYSAESAKEIILKNNDIACAILDVVMESDQAGLDLTKWIRDINQNKLMRIVLRTGQPGQAPEKSVIRDYDINDYKSKTELTSQKLYTLMYTALRSYEHIIILERSKIGMENVIKATKKIIGKLAFTDFLQSTLEQLTILIGVKDSVVLNLDPSLNYNIQNELISSLSTGVFSNHTIKNLDQSEFFEIAKEVIKTNISYITNSEILIYCPNKFHPTLFYVKPLSQLDDLDIHLLNIFAENISMVLDNITLNEQIRSGQSELVYRLGTVVESRSKETGKHVKRVALYSQLLAKLYGLSEEQCELIVLASPLHDIGKVSTPDSILQKPGSLDKDEWKIMQEHAQIGFNMLSGSNLILLETGSKIAGFHHEKYDGTGYPNRLKGDEIPIEGRITSIADVFDALGSKRCYKEAWPMPKVIKFIQDESGKSFDPILCQLFTDNLDQFIAIHNANQDE